MEIVEKPTFKVVGLLVESDWEGLWVDVPKAWDTLLARQAEIQHRSSPVFMDISLGKNGDRYTELVCAEVTSVEHVPDGMVAREIPGQRYLHQQHVGELSGIAESFGELYEWAGDNDLPIDDFLIDAGYTSDAQEQTHDLYIRLSAE